MKNLTPESCESDVLWRNSGDDIRAAGQKYDVSDIIIVAGYKKSVEECGDQVVDTQAYTPTASVISFAGPAALSNGSTVISPTNAQSAIVYE